MNKTIFVAIVSAVLGAIGGIAGGVSFLRYDVEPVPPPVVDTGGVEALDDRLAALEERLEQERDKNERLRARLEAQAAESVPAAPEADTGEEAVDLNRVLGALTPGDKRVAEHLADEALEAAEEERREEWRQRREEWSNNFRGGMAEFLDTAYANANTPAEQERIAALGEYGEAMFELRRQMSEAETDEERALAGQAMRENFEGMRTLMQEQQDHMLRETLKEAGVNKPKQQNQLIKEIQDTMDSPFFWGSGGGGFGGRGFGGPPGGGRGGDRGSRDGR